ncbi:hypothetical protein DYH09_19825 [bacterium CPR1]|nr:hypothetical protein [bacterium CPR1]
MMRVVTFTTPQEHPAPWLLCRRPELLLFLFPTVQVGGHTFHPDALLRLNEGGRNRFVAVMVEESRRELSGRIPLPLLKLRSVQLQSSNLFGLIARVRELLGVDAPRPETGWLEEVG